MQEVSFPIEDGEGDREAVEGYFPQAPYHPSVTVRP